MKTKKNETLGARETLSSLIESAGQTHLTIYLRNRGDLADLKRQLKGLIEEAREFLEPVLVQTEQSAFLQPIEGLLEDARVLKQLRGSIGLFRTSSEFRVLSLSVDVTPSCHVATTFHVKPLLRWMQWDSEFLLLGLKNDSAHLYLGSQESLRKIDSVLYPNRLVQLLKEREPVSSEWARELKRLSGATYSWMNDWIQGVIPSGKPKLFFAGEKLLVDGFSRSLRYGRMNLAPVSPFFREEKVPEIVSNLRVRLRNEARAALELALLTFEVADEMKFATASIRQIARAAVEGRIKKLVIAENREVFGKLNPETGKLTIHPFDLDHEDDDLLDDLAQRVLISGGEVYVACDDEIPKRKPILAILEDEKKPAAAQVGADRSLSIRERNAV